MKYIRDFKKKQFRIGRWRFSAAQLTWRNFFTVALWAIAGLAVLVAITFAWYSRDLPDPNKLLTRDVPQSTKIYARDGSLLYEIHGEVKRTLIPFSDMNDNIKHATIAIEDKNFYNEGGLNLRGIARSIFSDITSGGFSQGGSTITQQFVRNAILTREKTIPRKIKEAILSIEINERFSKDDILKLYLNEIPYGRNAYGIEAGASAYFGIHAKDMDLAQAAYLAAIPQAPTYFNPLGPNRQALDDRKNQVLQDMLQQGYINQDQYNKAKGEVVTFLKTTDALNAPHFVAYVQDYLSQKYGEQTLETGGLQVTTTLDPKLQNIAETVVKKDAAVNETKYNAYNAALVAIDPKTGQILAMVGSKDYSAQPEPAGCKPGVNCAFEPYVNAAISQRQPGSSAKPYIYGTAFDPEFKMSPATLRLDVTTDFGSYGGKEYIPQNYTGQQYGPVSIRQAFAGSLNISAVKTLDQIGVDNAVQTMHAFGITSPLQDCGLSLVLGGCEVRLLDHVSGYATFATDGVHHQESAILKVLDANGNTLEQYQDQSSQVMDPQAAYEVENIMTDNNARSFIFGAHSPLILSDRTVAAKTGTSQNFHDGWTLGYTPSLAAGVWVGNNDGRLLKSGADGVVVAAPIWHDFMQQALAGTPAETFQEPSGIQHVVVDSVSGLLPNQYTPTTKTEIFASYAVPTTTDNVHMVYTDPCTSTTNGTGSLTVPTLPPVLEPTQTPICDTAPKLYSILHSEMPNNPSWEQPVISWVNSHPQSGFSYPPAGSVPVNGGPAVTGTTGGSPTPTAGGSGGQIDNPGSPPTVNITAPQDGATLSSGNFTLLTNIVPDKNNQIVRVDFLIDGTIVDSKTGGPFNFDVNQTFANNSKHTFAVHAVDDKNNTADDSITLKFKSH